MKQLLSAHSDKIALVAASGIVVLSLLPPSDVQQIVGGDKLNHFIAYGVLAIFALYQRQSWAGAIVVVAGILTLGGLIELVQPGFQRSGELLDLGANLAGVGIGAALVATARLT
ncbi:MAG: VanZ family protein [Nitrospirota bacterium]